MKKPLFIALAAASAVLGSSAASPAELEFSFVQYFQSSPYLVEDTATWTTSGTTPTIISFTTGSTTILASGTDAVYLNGVKLAGGTVTSVTFYNAPPGGFTDNSQIRVEGQQVFTGTDAAPVFAPGTYIVSVAGSNTTGLLTISVLPEPATWAMMLVGLGMIGFATRRRQKVSVSFA